jgi:hypothetical protein
VRSDLLINSENQEHSVLHRRLVIWKAAGPPGIKRVHSVLQPYFEQRNIGVGRFNRKHDKLISADSSEDIRFEPSLFFFRRRKGNNGDILFIAAERPKTRAALARMRPVLVGEITLAASGSDTNVQ